VVQRVPGDLGS